MPLTIAILADFPIWKITDEIPESKGHFAVWLYALYKSSVIPDNWIIHWIILSRQANQYLKIVKENHAFHIIPQTKKILGLLTAYSQDRKKVKTLLQTINPDLVHAWGTEHAYALAGGDFSGKRLLSMQGILTAYCQRSNMPLYYRLQQFWERKAMKKYMHITVESPWGKDRVKEIVPNSQVHLVEYGVEQSFFNITKNLSASPSCFYAGSISDTKGSEVLVECFSSDELAQVQLKIAGDGPRNYVKKLKNRATANITFLGRISREQMLQELSQTWCLVHPTLADTSPNIVKEARCSETPVISTPEGGQTQYIQNGLSGFICQVNNIDEMVDAVKIITESPETSIAMGAYDSESCKEKLRPELTAEKMKQLYMAL